MSQIAAVSAPPVTAHEASTHVLLRVLVAEVWPQIMALSGEEASRIPAPVMRLLSSVSFSGALGELPHESALTDARAKAAWLESVLKRQDAVLGRLAALADPLHAAAGSRPVVHHGIHGSARDYGHDLERIAAALGARLASLPIAAE